MAVRGAIGVDDDVIFQHLRAQPGDEIRAPVDSLGNDRGSNVIFNHLYVSQGTDKSISTNSGPEKSMSCM